MQALQCFASAVRVMALSAALLSAGNTVAQTRDPWPDPFARPNHESPDRPVKKEHRAPVVQPEVEATASNVNAKERQKARLAFGLGLGVPELYPLEGIYVVNRWVAIRGFYVWPVPFNIRVEMPADVISKKGIIVEHPDLTVNFKAVYGPQYGFESLVFPFGGGFHLFAGASYRKLSLKGGVTSKLLLRAEGGGDPLTTNSSVRLYADAATAQYVARGGLGYLFFSPMGIYINLFAGYSKPYKAHSNINVDADILNEQATNPEDVRAALDELKQVKEREMEGKALKAMEPAETLSLPILGFTLGVYF